jgi:hypothetical protein
MSRRMGGDQAPRLKRLEALQLLAGSAAPVVPASIQGNIIIDPQNATGVATSSGTNSSTVDGLTGPTFNSYANLVRAWGTYAPLFTANTNLVFASSHTDNSDPVIWAPFISKGAQLSIQGAPPATIANVLLSGTVAKNRAAGSNSLLETNLGASGAVAQRVQNNTNPSVAWTYAALGGDLFAMTQPFQANAIVGGTPTPNEVDGWIDTNSATLQSITQVDLAYLSPVCIDTLSGGLTLFRLAGLAPSGVGLDPMLIDARGATMNIYECALSRLVTWYGGDLGVQSANTIFIGGLNAIGEGLIIGGALMPSAISANLVGNNFGIDLDGDVIIGTAGAGGSGLLNFGTVYLDTEFVLSTASSGAGVLNYGAAVIYGGASGQLNLTGNSHFAIDASAGLTFTGVLTFPLAISAGIKLGSAHAASSITAGGVINQGITVTPAHLDAAAGAAGFGGNAFQFGSSNSVSNALT